MLRPALPLLACCALALTAGCGPKRPPTRQASYPLTSPSARPKPDTPALRYKKPEAAAILATGLVGAGATHPLALLCYAHFALDTADLLDLTPRYDRPVVAGLLGAGLGGCAAAGPWHQIVYVKVVVNSLDLLRPRAPAARLSQIVTRSRRAPTVVVTHHPFYTPATTFTTTSSRPPSRTTARTTTRTTPTTRTATRTTTTRPTTTTRTSTTTRPTTTTRTTIRTTTIRGRR